MENIHNIQHVINNFDVWTLFNSDLSKMTLRVKVIILKDNGKKYIFIYLHIYTYYHT